MPIRAALETRVKRILRRRLRDDRFRSTTFRLPARTGDSEAGHRGAGSATPAPTPVLMCLWNRPGRLADTLAMLDAQSEVPGGIELYLWNNNKVDHRHYLDVLAAAESHGSLRAVHIVRTPYNLGSIARFYWARRLAARGLAGPVIVIDDDENVSTDFVATCLARYRPRTAQAWWAWRILDSYFERVPASTDGEVDHIGPGGSVIDASLFLDDAFFDELPQRYWMLDDLWLSWFAVNRGFALEKLPVDIEFVLDETNQHHHLGPLKQEFYERLRHGGPSASL